MILCVVFIVANKNPPLKEKSNLKKLLPKESCPPTRPLNQTQMNPLNSPPTEERGLFIGRPATAVPTWWSGSWRPGRIWRPEQRWPGGPWGSRHFGFGAAVIWKD